MVHSVRSLREGEICRRREDCFEEEKPDLSPGLLVSCLCGLDLLGLGSPANLPEPRIPASAPRGRSDSLKTSHGESVHLSVLAEEHADGHSKRYVTGPFARVGFLEVLGEELREGTAELFLKFGRRKSECSQDVDGRCVGGSDLLVKCYEVCLRSAGEFVLWTIMQR